MATDDLGDLVLTAVSGDLDWHGRTICARSRTISNYPKYRSQIIRILPSADYQLNTISISRRRLWVDDLIRQIGLVEKQIVVLQKYSVAQPVDFLRMEQE